MHSISLMFRRISAVLLLSVVFSCTGETSEADKNRASNFNKQGLAQFRSGDLPAALQSFQAATQADPREGEYPNNAGMTLLQSGQPQEALKLFETAEDQNDDRALYPYNQALALVRLNRDADAIVALEKALEIKADYFDAFAYAGLIHYKNADYKKAAAAWEQATALQENAELESNLGLAYMNLENNTAAAERLQKAIRIQPGSALAHYNAGVFYQRQKNFAEAEKSYLKTIAIAPDKVESYMNVAIVQTALGNKPGAIGNLEEFVKRAPAAMAEQVKDAEKRLAELRK